MRLFVEQLPQSNLFTRERVLQAQCSYIVCTADVPAKYVGEPITLLNARSICVEVASAECFPHSNYCHVLFDSNDQVIHVAEYGPNVCATFIACILGVTLVEAVNPTTDYYLQDSQDHSIERGDDSSISMLKQFGIFSKQAWVQFWSPFSKW